MKTNGGAEVAQLTPSAHGWRLRHAGTVRDAGSLLEAVASVPPRTRLHLALPCQTALLERLTLPSRDRDELAGMAQLQLEKTLPYPVEEVTSDLEVISEEDEQSTVLSISVHTPALNQLCQPLRDKQRLPERITLFAQQIAAMSSGTERVFAIWSEQEHVVVAIAENGRLSWAQTIVGTDAEALSSELPTLLLTAELNGVGARFDRILLASDCGQLREALAEYFQTPIEEFPVEGLPQSESGNLLPADWAQESSRYERAEKIKQRLLLAAVVYLVLLAAVFLYLAWNKRHVQAIESEIAKTRPLIQASQVRQARWLTLASVLDPSRYTVEILYLVYRNRPSDDVKITQFDCTPAVFMVEGEALNAGQAIDFAEHLRADKDLSAFRIESGPPQILPNEHAQFRIYGKL
jgi:hypothetical protein